MTVISFLAIFIFMSDGSLLEVHKQREQSYNQWLKEREQEKIQREAAANEVRIERAKRELDAIRRRKQFRREIRTTQGNEAEHLERIEKLQEARLETREEFAQTQRQVRNYYERYILPLKKKEYGLELQP